jgi:peptidoglycan/LPS O-acetylase OafA/YrhL
MLSFLSYWLTFDPPVVSGGAGQILFFLFLACFAAGCAARMVGVKRMPDKHAERLMDQVGLALLVMGFLGVMLFFFSYERIRLFGARFWYPVWLLGLILWVGYEGWLAKKKIPLWRREEEERKQKNAYLPGRKK